MILGANRGIVLFLFLLLLSLSPLIKASALSTQSIYVSPNGLIAYWDFAQCTGTSATDRGDWGTTGTLTGGATNLTWVQGKYGCGLSFAGTYAYVSTSNVSILNLGNNAFTISAWVYPSSLTGTHAILGKSNPANYFPSIDFLLQGADVRFFIYNGSASGVDITGGATLSLNTWAYVAVSWNTTHACIYFNGILTPNGCQSASIISPTNIYPIYLGNQGQLNIQFLGNTDEHKIWGRALSSEEVYVDYLGTYANIENYYSNASAFSSLNTSIFLVGSNVTTFYNALAKNITDNHNAIATNLTNIKVELDATNNSFNTFLTASYSNFANITALNYSATSYFNAIAKNLTDMNLTIIATNNSASTFYNGLASNSSQALTLLTALGINTTATNNLLINHDNNLTTYHSSLDSLVRSLANLSAQEVWEYSTRDTNCSNCTSGDVIVVVNQTNTTNNYNNTEILNYTYENNNTFYVGNNTNTNYTYIYPVDLSNAQLKNISKSVWKYQFQYAEQYQAPSSPSNNDFNIKLSVGIIGLLILIGCAIYFKWRR